MNQLEKTDLQLGYIPLLDCVALLWAEHRGFYSELGLNVELVREASWASLRDRLAFEFLDAAHCLSAMLPAAAIGQDQLGVPLQTPLVLSQNRAYITLSQKLCFELNIHQQDSPRSSAEKIINALNANDSSHDKLYSEHRSSFKFAHVFKQSIHHYCLREWLALADQRIAEQIQLSTLPPPYMAEALSKGNIDGFCVGEPWNTQAEIMGNGSKILSSQAIIPPVADKVLAVTQEWAAAYPATLQALCLAIEKAQHELKNLDNFDEVWQLLIHFDIIRFECSPTVHVEKYHAIQKIIRSFVTDNVVPQPADFEWLLGQMQKWDKIDIGADQIKRISKDCIITKF